MWLYLDCFGVFGTFGLASIGHAGEGQWIHPLVTTIFCPKFHRYPSNSWSDFQSGPVWWANIAILRAKPLAWLKMAKMSLRPSMRQEPDPTAIEGKHFQSHPSCPSIAFYLLRFQASLSILM